MSSGRENRTSILPAIDPTIGILGPTYNVSDEIPTPAQIGVRRGNTLGDAVTAMKGVAYYVDTIGFGESSTGFSKGMGQPVKKFGINYFMPTGTTCSNGADMWMYVETIPKGDALGKTVTRAMKEMGLPELRGLAPGIIEDAKTALDPRPMFSAVFGSGYSKCELREELVGDQNGNIKDMCGNLWVYDKQSVYVRNGKAYQRKWVQATSKDGSPIFLKRDEFVKEQKLFNPDGTSIKVVKEGFKSSLDISSLVIATLLFSTAYYLHRH